MILEHNAISTERIDMGCLGRTTIGSQRIGTYCVKRDHHDMSRVIGGLYSGQRRRTTATSGKCKSQNGRQMHVTDYHVVGLLP